MSRLAFIVCRAFAYHLNRRVMFNDIAQLLQPRVTMATKKSCNLIGAAIHRRQAQVHVLQVTRPSLPGVGLAP